MPATFGVLTTIAAFTPMLMVSGPFGVIWKTIGVVVILCLAFSLVESKWILPAHLAHIRLPTNKRRSWFSERQHRFNLWVRERIELNYKPALELCLTRRYTTLINVHLRFGAGRYDDGDRPYSLCLFPEHSF